MTTERLLLSLGTTATWGCCLPRVRRSLLVGPVGILGLLGCNELPGSPLPAGTVDPSTYNTVAGALSMRNTAIYTVEEMVPRYIFDSGQLTDEIESMLVGHSGPNLVSTLPTADLIDERILPEETSTSSQGETAEADQEYQYLQGVRGDMNQAIGALATYDSAAPPAVRGELYALDGYAEILLADFFCSGVPLSTIDFQRDFTYQASSSTAQVYTDAISKLDTALALSVDSVRILNLARVLKGRALLALGNFVAAAQAVAAVPDSFQYQLAIQFGDSSRTIATAFQTQGGYTISDREGGTGLPYLSSHDPRTQTISIQSDNTQLIGPDSLHYPKKYGLIGFNSFTVADGIEARLIEAEAQLQPANAPSGPWLATLNTLRATIGLSDTTDPGTAAGRVSLLFQERAYWLFVTGHRQGDLRRLIRQYGRSQDQVYPSGLYDAPGPGLYGTDVTVPIPPGEYVNPLFHGCINRDA